MKHSGQNEAENAAPYMSKGVPALASKPPRARWSHVPRWHLSLDQVENNWAALGYAERMGLRPAVHLDINFTVGELDDPDRNASASLRSFLKLARQWIERRGGQTAYIYTLENRYSGIGETGVHAHVLIHVPDSLRENFHRQKRIWARNPLVGMAWRPGLFGAQGQRRQPIPSIEGVKGKLRYMSKDLDPRHWPIFAACPRFHVPECPPSLDNRGKPSNAPVYGLKTGVSRNINAKARSSYRHHLVEPA